MLATMYWLICFQIHTPVEWSLKGGVGGVLPGMQVETLMQDSLGFMWFGSATGLVRFDGTHIRPYRHLPNDSHSLSEGTVRVLLEDGLGRFWVGTNGGLNLLDRKTGVVERFDLGDGGADSRSGKNVLALCADEANRVWVGTDAALHVLEESSIRQIPVQSSVTAVVARANVVWVATANHGIFTVTNEQIEAVALEELRHVRCLFKDRDGGLWLGTADHGIWRLGPQAAIPQRVEVPWPVGQINAIDQDSTGTMWVGTDKGLFQYDRTQTGPQWFVHLPDDQSSIALNDSIIGSIFCDDTGLVWVCTSKPGVNLADRQRERFRHLETPAGGVWSLWQDEPETLWVGTKQGLLRVELSNEQQHAFIQSQNVRMIRAFGDEHLLVGTDGGLFRIDKRSSQVERFLNDDRIWDLAFDRLGHIWLASDRGLIRCDAELNVGMRLSPSSAAPNKISHRVVTSLAPADRDSIWMGTFGGGVNRISLQGEVLEVFQASDATGSLSANDVMDLMVDASGQLWVCTLSGGLNRLTSEGVFERFMQDDGLPQNAVAAICQDNSGTYWVLSAAGIAVFNPELRSYHLYRDIHGVQIGSATPGTVMAFDDHLWFGGTNAVVQVDPERMLSEPEPPLLLSDIYVDNELRYHYLDHRETLILEAGRLSFSVQFARCEFRAHDDASAYQREGIDRDWVAADTVSYTQYLPFGGEGRLWVKGADTYHRWVERPLEIRVTTPAWVRWLPLWITLGLILLTALIYAIVNQFHKSKQKKLMEQAQLARQRATLAESQQAVEAKARRLQEEHNRIMQEYLEQLSNEIANELHDGPLGQITGLGFHLSHLGSEAPDDVKNQLRMVAQEAIPEICDDLRNLCGELLSPDMRSGLIHEMEHYADVIEAQTPGLTVHTEWQADVEVLSAEQKATVFRVYRTLMKNVSKHAGAKSLSVLLTSDDSQFILKISDDGCGFVPPEDLDQLKSERHYGLYLANYFCTSLGGALHIKSQVGVGTTMEICVPIKLKSSVVT